MRTPPRRWRRGGAPTAADAADYNAHVEAFDFVADVDRDFDDLFAGTGTIPRVLVIDTRTMTIVHKATGNGTGSMLAAVDALLDGA